MDKINDAIRVKTESGRAAKGNVIGGIGFEVREYFRCAGYLWI